MADLTSLFLFYFIFELLRIFAVMINTAKLELINAAENCLLKFFLVRTFFNNIQKLLIFFFNHSLSIPFSFGEDQMV